MGERHRRGAENDKRIDTSRRNSTKTNKSTNIKINTMARTYTVYAVMALALCVCAVAPAKAQEPQAEPQLGDMIGDESAAMLNASLETNATAQQDEAPPADGIEYPVFNATTIFPGGVFNPQAYSAWLEEVSAFYTNLYSQGASRMMQIPRMPYTGRMPFTGAIPNIGYTGYTGGWFPGRYAEQAYSNFMNAFRG